MNGLPSNTLGVFIDVDLIGIESVRSLDGNDRTNVSSVSAGILNEYDVVSDVPDAVSIKSVGANRSDRRPINNTVRVYRLGVAVIVNRRDGRAVTDSIYERRLIGIAR